MALREFSTVAEMHEFYRDLKQRRLDQDRAMIARRIAAAPPVVPDAPAAKGLPPPPPLSHMSRLERIILLVADHFNMTPQELRSPARKQPVFVPRAIACYLASRLCKNLSMPEIGRRIGGRDHATILHSIGRIEQEMERDPQLRELVLHLQTILEAYALRYGKIDALDHKVYGVEAAALNEAHIICGLEPTTVEHKIIQHEAGIGGIGMFVDANSLFVPPVNQHYFSIGPNLYGGNALLYRYDAWDKTVDFASLGSDIEVRFYESGQEVSRAISWGEITRPTRSINGRVVWEWPQARSDRLVRKLLGAATP